VAEIERLAARGLQVEEFCQQASDRLRRGLGFEGACWHTIDPETLLITSDLPGDLEANGVLPDDLADVARQLIVSSEYVVDDVNTFAELARRRRPVGVLSEATRGRPERSPRYRELHLPSGNPFELRAALRLRGRTWGAVVLMRREEGRDFLPAEASLVARLSRPLAKGLRAALLVEAAGRGEEPSAPGLVVLGPHDDVELLTPPARRLFAELSRVPLPGEETLPAAVLSLAAITRAEAPHGHPLQTCGFAVPARGGWIRLHASTPEGAPGRVAIILERARGDETAPLRLEAYGLTAREREIAALLVRGLSSTDIAARLVLSLHTVHDHVKSILEKTETRNRRELIARVFFADYWPHIERQTPLDSRGTFVEEHPNRS
jgi:DNA-binding CsgD family transcriptional regulator